MQMQAQKLDSLLKDTQGANVVEYIILVAVMAILAIAVFMKLADSVETRVDSQVGAIENME